MKRVLIRDKKHPWYGQAGVLTGDKLPTGQYIVRLDNSMGTGCYLNQLEYL